MIRLVVMLYVGFPLSLWNIEDLLFEHRAVLTAQQPSAVKISAPIET